MTFQKKILGDFVAAVQELSKALQEKSQKRVIQAGCIQYFEFSFELAWKAVKVFAEREGLGDLNSPKSCLEAAFRLGWITDADTWLSMLNARNKMSHTYDSDDALSIYKKLSGFLQELQKLVKVLAERK